jgi:hypothetical protein
VYVIPVGPGEREALADTIASIRHHEGDEVGIVVADDATHDCGPAAVREIDRAAAVITARWPTGGPPRQSPFLFRAFQHALALYDAPVLVKLDADALVTGAGLCRRAAEVFATHPDLGILGTTGVRADGVAEDYSYDAWVLEHESRWSTQLRRLLALSWAAGVPGTKVHGGVYVLSRAALDAAGDAGTLAFRPPWWTLMNEDLCVSLAIGAAGFGVGSWGAPGEPTASASRHLPVPKEEVVPRGILAVHSVRRGTAGEDEAELRAYFRSLREGSAGARS